MATDAIDKTTDAISNAIDALQEQAGPAIELSNTEAPVDDQSAEAGAVADDGEPESEIAETSDDLSEIREEAKQYYGFTDAEIERYGDALPSILARLDQQASSLKQGSDPEGPRQEPQRQELKEDPKPLTDVASFDLAIDKEEWTDEQIKVLDALKSEINKDRTALSEQRKAMEAVVQVLLETHKTASETQSRSESASQAEFSGAMDDFFSKLPEEFADVYGKEAMSSLSPNSPKVAARNALVKEMHILAEFDKSAGRPTRGFKEQATRTLRALHADKSHQAARREADKQIKSYGKRGIARPSGRAAATANTPEARKARALAAIEKFSPKLGI